MYARIWRHLPGPTWFRVIEATSAHRGSRADSDAVCVPCGQ